MITKNEALEIVDSLDDYARMGIPGGVIYYGVPYLEEYIKAVSKDAERYQKLRQLVGAQRTIYRGNGVFDLSLLPPVGNIMKGVVCEHLDDALDVLLEC